MAETFSKGNVFESFAAASEQYGGKTAIRYLGTPFTYEQILKLAEHFAASLREQGIQEGERVILYIPNSLHWIVSWLGVLRAGAVVLPITPIYTEHDLHYIANDSQATAIVCSDTNYGYVEQVVPDTNLKTVVVVRLSHLLPWWKRLFGWGFDRVPRGKIAQEENVCSFQQMVRSRGKQNHLPVLNARGEETFELLYTGGTTKFPKGVPISHGLYLESALEQIRVSEPLFPVTENVVVGTVPLFHILGQTCALSTLLVGGTIIPMPKVNLDAIFDTVQRFKAKTLIGVPTLYRMILEHDRL
ncbi:MAG: AMP-binding protein, partial [Desulfatiglandaceae bacterium]